MVLDEVGVVENNGSIFGYTTDVFRRFWGIFCRNFGQNQPKKPGFWYQNLGIFWLILAEISTKNASKMVKNIRDRSKNAPIVFNDPNFI